MNVLILGLGQYPQGSGVAAAVYFAQHGHEVIATDLKTAAQLKENVKRLKKFKNVKFRLGKHDLKDIRWAELIVRNPRVRRNSPEMKLAAKLDIPLESDLSIFMKSCPCPVVGVTGTRGKSTTTTLIHQILSASKKWRRVWLGGNILVSPLTFIDQVKENDIVVLEMSSWQLEATGEAGVSPQYALWTNLMRDHLNTYSSMEEYAEAKAQIFRHQQPGDVVFLPQDTSFNEYAKEAPGKVVRIKMKGKMPIKASGEHNQQNARAATALATHLGVKSSIIRKVLSDFGGLQYRQEVVAVKNGIMFVNDTTATTPDATIAALNAYKGKVLHLIFGGNDKELEFEEFVRVLAKRKDVATYLMPGDAHKKIEPLFKKYKICYMDVKDLKGAMKSAKLYAEKGDVILLSPGATSFGQFKNEFDRGEQFNKLVKAWR
jgi:UDP-N-acetylmuramoylalanine--D-glutamate ligase